MSTEVEAQMNFGLPTQAIDAIAGAAGLVARLPDIERAVGEAAARAQETLERILERIQPVTEDLDALRESARSLESRLDAIEPHLTELERLIDPLEQRFLELTEAANRLDGALVHVLDRIPGLSAEGAREVAHDPR